MPRDSVLSQSNRISLNVNLPQLVVIGSQSSGKSSLFEGITRLGLPRSSGTCTRGTKRGTTWRCRIGLKYEFQVSGERLPHPRLETFGEDIFDPYDVPERISRAQAAILRPDVDWRNFLESGQYETSSDFSFNSVTVEIEGPEVEDLTFVDLPGIIAADPEGQPGLKERVRGMALAYVQKEESLILLVYQCDQDDLTQGAVELAKECDPQGNRTIVVLTKPDLPTLRSTAQVLMAPWKQRFRESENWFVVRQPDGNYINQFDPNAWGVAREEEEIFFREKWQEEWNDQSLQSRLGTKNLRNYLPAKSIPAHFVAIEGNRERPAQSSIAEEGSSQGYGPSIGHAVHAWIHSSRHMSIISTPDLSVRP
ncbi:2704_t:CDS:2, partial [Acaulospora colombiana]